MTERASEQPNRPGSPVVRAIKNGSVSLSRALQAMMSARGPGFRKLAMAHSWAVAGDALVALALAGTLFFQVPSSEARSNVALYLLLTLAPFAVLGPALGALFARFPAAFRAGLMASSGARVVVVLTMFVVGLESLWLYPLAFLLLVFSRMHGIARASLLPVVLDRPVELVGANARIARIGVIWAAMAVLVGALVVTVVGGWLSLALAAGCFVAATRAAMTVPDVSEELHRQALRRVRHGDRRASIPRSVALARLATAGVRYLNGFLLLLVAFAFRDQDAGVLDFGALLGAGALGFFIAAMLAPLFERKLREEPMVLAALAIEAAAAFIASQIFGLAAAAALAWAAGFAWGTAKLGFDGLLQRVVDPSLRGSTFTASETLFQIAWVIGALLPVAVTVPIRFGLSMAGVAALAAQVVYVAGLVMPGVDPAVYTGDKAADQDVPRPPDLSEYL